MEKQITSAQGKRRMRGQSSPKKQTKLAVSQNPENTISYKKTRNGIDSSNGFIALSHEAMNSATQDYLARKAKNSVAIVENPAISNSYGCLKQDESGRANDLNLVDKSLIPNIDSSTKRIDKDVQRTFVIPNAQFDPMQLSIPGENVETNNLCSSTKRIESELCTGFPLNKEVKPSQDIIVDGTDITYDISEDIRSSYFNLCRTQNTLLHTNLSEGIFPNHAVFYIRETVNIASAIRGCNMSTPDKDIAYWRKALESYSSVGMNVDFLQTRVDKILDIKLKATQTVDRKRCEEAKAEGEWLEGRIKGFELNIDEEIEKIKGLELKIEKMTENIRCLELEIENMKEKKKRFDEKRDTIRKKAEEFEARLVLEATAPW